MTQKASPAKAQLIQKEKGRNETSAKAPAAAATAETAQTV
jgi:hypothetical protein